MLRSCPLPDCTNTASVSGHPSQGRFPRPIFYISMTQPSNVATNPRGQRMSSDPSAPPLVDALKASASKLKETKSVLEARARELDALKVHLDGQRDELD